MWRSGSKGREGIGRVRKDFRDEEPTHAYFTIEDAPARNWHVADRDEEWDGTPTQHYESDSRERAFDWRRAWKWTRRGLLATFILVVALVAWLFFTAPLSKSLEPVVPPQVTLLASDGTPIARSGAVTEPPVPVAELPPHVVEAFMAIEDRRFYDHWGVDPRGIACAAWTGYGGGSTITQQLAKFTFLTPELSVTRKAREMLIAFWLETWLTKDEILTRYLGNTYFGDNVYGLHAASLHYFYRKPQNLTVAQAAMLAGLVQAPSRMAPSKHYERAEARMRVVLSAMEASGYLRAGEARTISSPALDMRPGEAALPTGTYFADWALPEARLRAGPGYARQTLTTTLDARLQGLARDAIARAPLGGAQAALIAMRTNGEVVAMVGGTDYAASPFNRATQAKRQAGSTFKLFVYLAALEAGARPSDAVSNRPIETGSYRPKNARDRYSDTLTLEQAFAQSSNVAAVRLFEDVGSEAVIDMARAYGIEAEMDRGDPSLALGTASVPLIDLVAAYAGVAGNAFPIEPSAFPKPEQGWLDRLWNGPSSLGPREHEAIQAMLRQAINSGTGRAAMLAGPNYGKTGTTQDNRDALFVGFAGDLVVGVWIGNDDNSPLDGVSGGGAPARIWKQFMQGALRTQAPTPPRADPSGPVEPLDVPDPGDIPDGMEGVRVRIDEGGVILGTDFDGIPVDLRVGDQGVLLEEETIERARAEAEARARAEIRRAEQRVRERIGTGS